MPALVLIRQVQPVGMNPERQKKMAELYQKGISVQTARDETGEKVTRKQN